MRLKKSSGAIGARPSADVSFVCSHVGNVLGLLFQNLESTVAGLIIAFIANLAASIYYSCLDFLD